jgi:hypothetical protein
MRKVGIVKLSGNFETYTNYKYDVAKQVPVNRFYIGSPLSEKVAAKLRQTTGDFKNFKGWAYT